VPCSGYWNAHPADRSPTSDLAARIDKWIRLESVRRKPAAPQETGGRSAAPAAES